MSYRSVFNDYGYLFDREELPQSIILAFGGDDNNKRSLGDAVINKGMFTSIKDEWNTPKSFYNQLNKEFSFNFDPCPEGALWDGLALDWGSRTFCNPPYSQIKKWVKKAWDESQLGKTVVLLIPSRTDTSWWHEYCMKGEIRFIKGRLKFGGAKWNAPFPSAVVVFTPSNQPQPKQIERVGNE